MCYVRKGEFTVTRSYYGKNLEVRLEEREREREREREECVIQLLIVTHEEHHLPLLVAYVPH